MLLQTVNKKSDDLSATYTVELGKTETLGSWGPSGLKFAMEIDYRIEDLRREVVYNMFFFNLSA